MTSKEPNLSTAGGLLLIEMVGYVTLSFALSQLELPGKSVVFVCLMLFNLVTASYLAMAARAQGKSAILYGLISLVPPGALFSFFRLRTNELYAG